MNELDDAAMLAAPRPEVDRYDDASERRLRGRNIATHPRRVKTALNRLEALRLRAAGRSWAEIATALNLGSPKAAYNMVRTALSNARPTSRTRWGRDVVRSRMPRQGVPRTR